MGVTDAEQEQLIARFAEAVQDAVARGSDLETLEVVFRFLDSDDVVSTYRYARGDERALD